MFGEGDDDGEVGFGSPSFSLMNGTMQDVDQQQMMMQTQQQTQQQQQYGDTQQQQSIGDDEFQQQQQLQFQKRSLSTSNASLMQFRSGSMNNISSLLGGQQDEFGDLNDFNSSSTNTTIQGSSNSLTSSLNNLKQSQSNFARPATQRPLSRSMEDDQLAQQQQQQQQLIQQQQQDETNEDQQEEEEENEEQEEEEEDEEDEDGNPSQPQQPVSSRGLRMPIGRAVPANEENEEEDENEQEGEEEEDEEEEEEEDPITREQHFFELSKKQYESMLTSDPNNATVKQRLQELYVRHNEFLARHNRPIAEQPDAKRQKLS